MPTMSQWPCIAASGVEHTRFSEIPNYSEGLYDLNNQLYAWMVPNGSWGEANAGLVVGDGASLLVDTLWDVKYTRAMLDAMGVVTAVHLNCSSKRSSATLSRFDHSARSDS
jgi:hypothetical protein